MLLWVVILSEGRNGCRRAGSRQKSQNKFSIVLHTGNGTEPKIYKLSYPLPGVQPTICKKLFANTFKTSTHKYLWHRRMGGLQISN